jgi:hypothetical protein
MTRSAYAVTSARIVACTGCKAAIGKPCVAKNGLDMYHCHSARRKAADAKRTREVNPEAIKPFFTPSPEPIPSEYYHNVPGRDGIFTIGMKSEAFTHGAQAMKEQLEGLFVDLGGNPEDLDPPSYLPTREPLPPRRHDPSPDERHGITQPCFECGKHGCNCNQYPF